MGRVKLGELPALTHISRNLRPKSSLPRLRARFLAPSRRRPLGFYSLLAVGATASKNEIGKAFQRLSTPHLATLSATAHEKSVHTKQLQALQLAREVLTDVAARESYDNFLGLALPSDSSSTSRVQVHRREQSRSHRQIVSAINSSRRRSKRSNRPTCKAKTEFVVGQRCSEGRITKFQGVYANNKVTSEPWAIVRRPRKVLHRDRRLSKVVALRPDDVRLR